MSFYQQVCLVTDASFLAGIPWILDIISAVVGHAYGTGKSFEVRLTLDILNLVTVSENSVLEKIFSSLFPGSPDLPGPGVQEEGAEKSEDSTLGSSRGQTLSRDKD